MLSLMLIAATLAAANPSGVTASRITSGASSETAITQPAAKPKERRYCVKSKLTGSRLEHTTCQTRAEWLQQGFDPLQK